MRKTSLFIAAGLWGLLSLAPMLLPCAAQAGMPVEIRARLLPTLSRVYAFMSPEQIHVADALFSAKNPDTVDLLTFVKDNPYRGYADNRDQAAKIHFVQCAQARELTSEEYLHLAARLQIFYRTMTEANSSKQIPQDLLDPLRRLIFDIKTKRLTDELKRRLDRMIQGAAPADWDSQPLFNPASVMVDAEPTPAQRDLPGAVSASSTPEPALRPLAARYTEPLENIAPLRPPDPQGKTTPESARRIIEEELQLSSLEKEGAAGRIFEAVAVLGANHASDSAPLLKNLFDKYSQWNAPTGLTTALARNLLEVTTAALIHLLPQEDAQSFAAKALSSNARLTYLGFQTLQTLLRFVVNQHMTSLAPTLLRQAQAHEARLKPKPSDFTFPANISEPSWASFDLPTDVLIADLAYAAYLLSTDATQREEALLILVEKYMNNDREHDPLSRIICQIIDYDLAGDQARQERESLLSRLDRKQLTQDMADYQVSKESFGMSKLWGTLR